MALQLMDPLSTMPFFQPNQVLTYNHLNELASYLFQQERYTRNKLIGTGIVCNLTFTWTALNNGNAEVVIDDGVAITSAGYLIIFTQPRDNAGVKIPYTHRRNFTRLKEFEPFTTVIGNSNPTIHELITLDTFNSENSVPKGVLTDALKSNRVLILLYDIQALNVAKCLDESCDDKGKIYQYTPRPLLVPKSIIDDILNAANTQKFFTEPGRSWKGKESILFSQDFTWLKNLFHDNNNNNKNNLQEVTTPADLVNLFKAPCLDPELNSFRDKIDALITAFPWIFSTQLDCMKSEIAELNASTVGNLFKARAQTFRNAAANANYIQYLYDYLRDVLEAYNEMFAEVTNLVSECGGNEFIHPFHVMLGIPNTKDTLACYHEEKYNETNFKYRHYFVPSPVMDEQFMLYEQIQSLFKRLIRIIANFNVNQNDVTIKITPSKDYDTSIGDRALPYYYLNAAAESIKRVWNYTATRRNKIGRIKGYQLAFTQDELLDADTCRNDFYRIEGHIGSTAAAAATAINTLRNKYNLPFTLSTVTIQSTTKTMACSFPDLQEEFNYFRDRALGVLRDILHWFVSLKSVFQKNTKIIEQYNKIIDLLTELRDMLEKTRCIEAFDYNAFKKIYTFIWELIFDISVSILGSNHSNANQSINILVNILNYIFWKPLYKIWYMFLYRMDALALSSVTSLQSLATKTTGLEHLAGVRRGETFLLVSDTSQGDKVVADFNLPDLMNCSCDCSIDPCDGSKRSRVGFLQKPIAMVVDTTSQKENDLAKNKASFDPASGMYFLVLNGNGFYKGDSEIDKSFKITLDNGGADFPNLIAEWQDEKLVLWYKPTDSPKNNGFFKLNYECIGDFDEHQVMGRIYLYVTGKTQGQKIVNENVVIGTKPTAIYPYEKANFKSLDVTMRFDGTTKRRAIGEERMDVYTTQLGNEYAIFTDPDKLPYIRVVTAKTAGIEEIPFILTAGESTSAGTVVANVVDSTDKLAGNSVSGVIRGEDGLPLKDARIITASGKEVITNEKGEYTIAGMKAGDVMTIDKEGFTATRIQVNSKMTPDTSLSRKSTVTIEDLASGNLSDNLSKLTEGIRLSSLRNIMKK